MKRIVFLALVLAACSASAQVTKCKLPNGTITYGDGPCPAGAADSRVNTTANVVDGSDQRAAAARMRDDQVRNEQPAPGAAIIGGGSRRPGAPIDDAACRAAQRDLDVAGSRVRTEVARGNHPGPSGSAVKTAELKVDAACGTNMASARADLEDRKRQSRSNAPRHITNCNDSVCFDNLGDVYNKGAGNVVFSTSGAICNNIPGNLQCSGGR